MFPAGLKGEYKDTANAIQKQFDEEKVFEDKDSLLSMLISELKKNGKTFSFLYNKLNDELSNTSAEYQNHYYLTNYNKLFALALMAHATDNFFNNLIFYF